MGGARPADAGGRKGASTADKLILEALSNELQALKQQFEARGAELAEQKERNLRLQAEFENFRRRTLKERQEALQYGHQNLVKDLLPTVDNLERAIAHAHGSGGGDLQALLQGVVLVQRDLMAVLVRHGVSLVDTAQGRFDPALHEAIAQVPDAERPTGSIVDVMEKGYLLRERMLRPARVVVSHGGPPASAAKDPGESTGSEG
jgi:molecular chaperone GrpE